MNDTTWSTIVATWQVSFTVCGRIGLSERCAVMADGNEHVAPLRWLNAAHDGLTNKGHALVAVSGLGDAAINLRQHLRIVGIDRQQTTVCLVRRGEVAPVSTAPPDGEQTLHSKQSAAILQRAIRALPRGQEQVLREAFGEAKTQLEIAAEQILLLGTLKSRIRLTLTHLRIQAADVRVALTDHAAWAGVRRRHSCAELWAV